MLTFCSFAWGTKMILDIGVKNGGKHNFISLASQEKFSRSSKLDPNQLNRIQNDERLFYAWQTGLDLVYKVKVSFHTKYEKRILNVEPNESRYTFDLDQGSLYYIYMPRWAKYKLEGQDIILYELRIIEPAFTPALLNVQIDLNLRYMDLHISCLENVSNKDYSFFYNWNCVQNKEANFHFAMEGVPSVTFQITDEPEEILFSDVTVSLTIKKVIYEYVKMNIDSRPEDISQDGFEFRISEVYGIRPFKQNINLIDNYEIWDFNYS